MSRQRKSVRSILNILFILFLLTAWLGAAPGNARAATVPPPAFMPTTNCTGSGYIRSFTLGQALPRSDDGSTGPVALGFSINYFGSTYNQVYINTNGNLTFGAPISLNNYLAGGLVPFSVPAIAPFYADVDTTADGNPNLILYDQVTVDGRPAFAVRWNHVGFFYQHHGKVNDFMVILIDRSDVATGDFDIEFDYHQVKWESGDATNGTAGLGGISAVIGLGDGFASPFDYQVAGSLVPGSFLDSNLTTGAAHTAVNSSNCGQWVFPVQGGEPVVESWVLNSLDQTGCNDGDISVSMLMSNVTFPSSLHFRTQVEALGVRYMDQDGGVPAHNGLYGWSLGPWDSAGPITGTWPLPDNTPITVHFMLVDGIYGPVVTDYVFHLNRCNAGGTLSNILNDVPPGYWADEWIYRLYIAGVTNGCSASPLVYCPFNTVTRAQMAKFLEVSMHGAGYTPPAGTGNIFGDVPTTYWADNWIEKLYADGITNGCGSGNYCPEDPVTRAQMAKFLMIAKHGGGYTPPAPTGVFPDVLTSNWAAGWIEELYHEGITNGCGGGNYCPDANVTRDQMAKFLVLTFNIP